MPTDIISRECARAKGLKRFFDGIACCNGHVSERYVLSRNCVACAQAQGRKFDASHPETRSITVRITKWRNENPEKYDEYLASEKSKAF